MGKSGGTGERLRLCLGFLGIQISHSWSHVLIESSLQVHLVSLEGLPAAQERMTSALGISSSRKGLSVSGCHFILVYFHSQFSDGFNKSCDLVVYVADFSV